MRFRFSFKRVQQAPDKTRLCINFCLYHSVGANAHPRIVPMCLPNISCFAICHVTISCFFSMSRKHRLFSFSVSRHSEKNKMDAHNLAVVFGPTLLRIPNEQDMIAYQSHVNGMIEFIIKHCGEIFPGDTEPDGPQLSGTEESDSEEGQEGGGVGAKMFMTLSWLLPCTSNTATMTTTLPTSNMTTIIISHHAPH